MIFSGKSLKLLSLVKPRVNPTDKSRSIVRNSLTSSLQNQCYRPFHQRMRRNDGNTVLVHTAHHVYRQSSLPTYEEATGITPAITDYTEITLESPTSLTENQQYMINIHDNHQDVDRLLTNEDEDRLIEENYRGAVDNLSENSLVDRRRVRIKRQKNVLRQIIYIGFAFLVFIFIVILGKDKEFY